METSCVNHEIEIFNRKLRKRLERLGKEEMIDVGKDRNLFTRHGQHLNSMDRECMAHKISSTIKCVLNKKVEPISGKWYMDNETPRPPTSTAIAQGKRSDDKNANYSLLDEDDKEEVMESSIQDESIHMKPRISKSQKKPAATKSDKFFMVDDKLGSTNNTVTVLHQNICGLRTKTDELLSSISPNSPLVLCLSEHHLKTFELDQISINGYKRGAAHSRQVLKGGGVCIFVRNTLECTKIDLDKYCKEQDIEICMLKLTLIPRNGSL